MARGEGGGEGGGFLIWPGGGGDPGLTKGSLEMRRRIAAAMAARQRAYPKTLGEGLTYFGESLGEAGMMWRLAQQEAAYKKMVEAEAGANVPVEARGPTVTPTTPTTPPAPTEAPVDPPPEAPVVAPPAPGASVFPDPPPAPVAAVEPPPAVPPNVVAEANRPVPTTSFRPPPAPVDLVTPEPPPERAGGVSTAAYVPPAGPTASFAARFAGAPPEADPFVPPAPPPSPLNDRAAALVAPQQGPFDPEPFDQRKLITPGGPPDPAVALAPKPGDWQPTVPQTADMRMPRPRPSGDLPAQAAMTPRGAPGGNVQSWYNFATRPREEGGLGLSHAQAAAKVANLQAESGPNIRPWGVVGDRGTAFGAAQWRGDRFANLQRFAAERGMDHRTTEAQQAFMRHEYDTTEKRAYQKLLAAQTPEAAATAINRYYERSADRRGVREQNAARLAGMLGPGDGNASVATAAPPEAGPAQTRITVNARPPEAELPDQRDVIASVILGQQQQQPLPGGVQQAQASPEDVRSEALLRETMGMRRPGSPFRATASRGDIQSDGPAAGLSPLGSATGAAIGDSVQQRQRIYDAVQQQQQGPAVPPVDPTIAAASPPSIPTGTGSNPPTVTDIPPMPRGIRPGDVLTQAAPAAPRTERPRERIPQPEDFPMSEDEKRGYRLQSRGRALEDQGLIDQGETLIKHGAGIRKQKFDTAVKDYQDRLILRRQKEIADEAWQRGAPEREQARKQAEQTLRQGAIAPPAAPTQPGDPRLNTPESPQRSGIPSAPPVPPGISPSAHATQWAPLLTKAVDAASKAEPEFKQSVDLINQLRNHPGREAALGMSGVVLRNIKGTDAYDFEQLRSQAQGRAFLQAYASLKGGGSITEIEGTKATEAVARLNAAQSKEAFDKALNDLEKALRSDLEQAQRKVNRPVTAWRGAGDNESHAYDVGYREGDYEYRGGNPKDRSSWSKFR